MKGATSVLFIIAAFIALAAIAGNSLDTSYSIIGSGENCIINGSIKSCVSQGSIFDLGTEAVISPNVNVIAGQTVGFDSRMLMNCGLCDVSRYGATIKGYVIRVYNPNGNAVAESGFANSASLYQLKCGEYGNVYYEYTVPSGAIQGTWNIKLEVAVSPSSPFGSQADCIVAYDSGSFVVGSECPQKLNEVKYCYSEQILYVKPAGTCAADFINCGDSMGTGYKCLNSACVLVEKCGDDLCDENENPYNCYDDCGRCGDNICAGKPFEDENTCPEDCAGKCGDNSCNPREEFYCPEDCAKCGDGKCMTPFENTKGSYSQYYCAVDCAGQIPDAVNEVCNGQCDIDHPSTIEVAGVNIPTLNIFSNMFCKLGCWWAGVVNYLFFGLLFIVVVVIAIKFLL